MLSCSRLPSVLHDDYDIVKDKSLWIMCARAEALTTAWTKYYCQYQKESRTLTMVAYSQTVGKGTSGVS